MGGAFRLEGRGSTMKKGSRGIVGFALALAAGLAALLWSVSGGRPAAAPGGEITSMHMSGVYADAARSLAGEFERQTGVRVKIVAAPYLVLREKQLTDLINGTAQVDVMQVAMQWDGEMLPRLLRLDGMLAGRETGMADLIPLIRQNSGRWDGETRSVPFSSDVITLVYRTDVFAARAEEFQRRTGRPLRPPSTWEEYLELARFFHSDTLHGNIIMGLKEQNYGVWSGIFAGLGGQLMTPEWQPAFDSEVGVRALEIFTEMFRYAPRESGRLGIDEANALFLQGKGAMYLTWPTLLWAQMQDTNLCRVTGKLAAAVIPGGRPQVSGWSLGINGDSTHREASLRWIEFLTNAENTKRLLLSYGKGSPRVTTAEDPECRAKVFFVESVSAGLRGGTIRPRIPESQELCDYLELQISEAVAGRVSAREALRLAADRWRSVLGSSKDPR